MYCRSIPLAVVKTTTSNKKYSPAISRFSELNQNKKYIIGHLIGKSNYVLTT